MADHVRIDVPLVNPNEPEAVVVDLMVAEGDSVSTGDVLCSLETSKSIEDVVAEAAGFVIGLAIELGATVTAGDLLCYLAADASWVAPVREDTAEVDRQVPDGVRATAPAVAAARELGVDLASLPTGALITERHVREAAAQAPRAAMTDLPSAGTGSVIVFGAGGHGKTLIELIRAVGDLSPAGIVDDSMTPGTEVLGVPVFGGRAELDRLRDHGFELAVNAVGGITNMAARIEVTEALAGVGFTLPALVHPSAVVEPSARLGAGSQILAHAYVGSDVTIGPGVIVNTSAVVSHDCTVGDHANLAPGCLLAGGIDVGARTLLGMGVTTYLGIEIGSDVRVGNSAVLNASVPDGRKIRGGSMWEGFSAGPPTQRDGRPS